MSMVPENSIYSEVSLQLLLFVDKHPSPRKQIEEIRNYLQTLKTDYTFELQIIEVGTEPYLAEHFKVVATPTLIKIQPEPRHTLAGTNLVAQLKNWWPRWLLSVEEARKAHTQTLPVQVEDASLPTNQPKSAINSVVYSAELIQLSDEIFSLQKEKQQLSEQLQFKERVIALLAHDMRSPLTAVSLALETLEIAQKSHDPKTYKLTPELTSQLITQARGQIQLINRMIKDILQASLETTAELRIELKKLNIAILCNNILNDLSEKFTAKSQTLKTDIPIDLPFIYGDEERLRQVFVNLLENAIKYTPEGGKIEVSILHRTTQKIQVSINDTGPGIPPENTENIFEDHFRLQRDQDKEGYGLGLALCQRIIRAHYGHIWVDSLPHQGSCFQFTLPVYQN